MAQPQWLAEYVKSDRAREVAKNLGHKRRRHGASQPGDPAHSTYRSWQAMKRRCDSPRDTFYARYGGRGITYDPRWAGFDAFLADMGERPQGTTLDRVDNDGPYEKSNCRWATASEQRNNHPQARGWKVRNKKPVVYADKAVVCMDGCGATGVTKSVVAEWRCPECRVIARRRFVNAWRAKPKAPCSAGACEKPQLSKGLCSMHYQRAREVA